MRHAQVPISGDSRNSLAEEKDAAPKPKDRMSLLVEFRMDELSSTTITSGFFLVMAALVGRDAGTVEAFGLCFSREILFDSMREASAFGGLMLAARSGFMVKRVNPCVQNTTVPWDRRSPELDALPCCNAQARRSEIPNF